MSSVQDQPTIRVTGLKKEFRRQGGTQVFAVAGVSLSIRRGEMVVVLGPSGCGKTTLLRCIAGLEEPTQGEIWSGDQLVSSGPKGVIVPPERRNFGMMFQSYAIWPHMPVFENVAYPLRTRGMGAAEIKERVDQILLVAGIEHLRNEYSAQLSGGQQQRVALARCLVANPAVILFDEPLSNVDAKVREDLRIELLTMQKRIGFAGVYVTHDQEEAMAMADRVVIMRDGHIVQIGTPREVYGAPNSRFVASFVGVVNEWTGILQPTPADGMAIVRTSTGDIQVAAANVPAQTRSGSSVSVIVRPEALILEVPERAGSIANAWPGLIKASMFLGAHCDYLIDVAGRSVRVRGRQDSQFDDGARVVVLAPPESLRVLPADGGEGLQAVEADRQLAGNDYQRPLEVSRLTRNSELTA